MAGNGSSVMEHCGAMLERFAIAFLFRFLSKQLKKITSPCGAPASPVPRAHKLENQVHDYLLSSSTSPATFVSNFGPDVFPNTNALAKNLFCRKHKPPKLNTINQTL
jgi:hypothetical protein